jgi:hypothetical protein
LREFERHAMPAAWGLLVIKVSMVPSHADAGLLHATEAKRLNGRRQRSLVPARA